MTIKKLNEIKVDLSAYIEDDREDLNNTKLATKFLEDNDDIKLSIRSIRRYISLIKDADEELLEAANEKDEEQENDTAYSDYQSEDTVEDGLDKSTEVSNISDLDKEILSSNTSEMDSSILEKTEEYTFDYTDETSIVYKGEVYAFPYTLVDLIHCAYSRHGLNLVSSVVKDLLDLDYDELQMIISNFRITKESLPYSAYSADKLNAGLLHNNLESNIDYLLDKLQKSDGTAINKLNKLYKKSIILQRNNDLKFRSIVTEIKKELPKIKINEYGWYFNTGENKSHTHLFIPDMHIGMNQDNYNIDIIKNKLAEVYYSLIDAKYTNIHVHFMGDIIHSVSGLNHKDSWKNMKQGTSGAEAIIQPYKLILDFLNSINSNTLLLSVDFVGGNHGRLQSAKDQENTAEAEKLIAFMIGESLPDTDVKFDPYRIVDNKDPNLTVIVLHGDKPIDKESGQSIAWEYGNSAKFNYIAVAHMHSRKQMPKDDGLRFRKEAFPAFCPADTYSKTVAHGSLPGYKIVITSADKLPTIVDIPLNYAT